MVTILDEPNKVKAVDRSNMLVDLAKTSDYCHDAIKKAKKVTVPTN